MRAFHDGRRWVVAMTVAVLGAFASLLTEAIKGSLQFALIPDSWEKGPVSKVLLFVGVFAATGTIALFSVWSLRGLLPVRTLVSSAVKPAKLVIMPISSQNSSLIPGGPPFRLSYDGSLLQLTGVLSNDIEILKKHAAICFQCSRHLSHTRSPNQRSFWLVLRGLAVPYEDIATLHAILTSYGASVSSHSEGVDFEDIEKMYTLLDTIVNDHPSVKSETWSSI